MPQWVKTLATKPDDLSSVPWTQMEEVNSYRLPFELYVCTCLIRVLTHLNTCMLSHTHKYTKSFKKYNVGLVKGKKRWEASS